ncbi:hypothetical protein ACIPM0_26695, partial [Pseudomonas sichuanensis]|uniref:hypothetical protein n=1 Tax=Pseudomonas sichuanensis TaxID=2213015 RepID=UPI003801592C
RRSVHQADLVKIMACLAAGHYRPEHKKTDSPVPRCAARAALDLIGAAKTPAGTLPPPCNLQPDPCHPQPINQISHLPCSPFPKDNARAFFPLRWQFPPTSLAGSLHISDMALTGRDELNAYGVVLNGGCT